EPALAFRSLRVSQAAVCFIRWEAISERPDAHGCIAAGISEERLIGPAVFKADSVGACCDKLQGRLDDRQVAFSQRYAEKQGTVLAGSGKYDVILHVTRAHPWLQMSQRDQRVLHEQHRVSIVVE